ncbi:MAG: DNA-3-methyladenine glycosylase I [Candidatus Thiodiazotropha sp. (ex Lucinoma kastoroae)]|nr:DNA-3-methyladenine glycosylase I [Candidatus Thiodiazotropha sp. (ex Lucinoma kastoroae)]MCU7861081.1 DNA-3-methyladenine glycosylase I [Candidatus Thiodiazotropha sp. (ex Lucinoma kastoroae)]
MSGDPCPWCLGHDEYVQYHDQEWGVPSYDPQHLFEMLILEGAQAGLSWLTILRKREGYRKAFDNFDAERIAGYGEREVSRLLADPGIVRNRLKVASAIGNAQAFLALEAGEGFSQLLWSFVDAKPIQNQWRTLQQVPATTVDSDAMSRELKRRGFRFVGSTLCYAFMQSVGMVNDHLLSCPRYQEVASLAMTEKS